MSILKRAQDIRVEEIRKAIAEMEARVKDLQGRIEGMEAEKDREIALARQDRSAAVGIMGYLAARTQDRHRMEAEISRLVRGMEGMREDMRQAWGERRKLDTLSDWQEEAVAKREAEQESAEADWLSISSYSRNK